jgi:hypothetical protein
MASSSILAEESLNGITEAFLKARRDALEAGHAIVYLDADGRYVQELPNGRRFEIRFDPSQPRESHLIVIRELS